MSVIQKVWRDIFNSFKEEGISIVIEQDQKRIIEMMITNRIDPGLFVSNLAVLIEDDIPSATWKALDIIKRGKGALDSPEATKSISHFASKADRPLDIPLWFLAAYPDVMIWFQKAQRKSLGNKELGKEAMLRRTKRMIRLLGLKAEDITKEEGELKMRHYKNLIKCYESMNKLRIEARANVYLTTPLWHRKPLISRGLVTRIAFRLRHKLYLRESQLARLFIMTFRGMADNPEKDVVKDMLTGLAQHDPNFFKRLAKTEIEILLMLIDETVELFGCSSLASGLKMGLSRIIKDRLLKLSRHNKPQLRRLFQQNPSFVEFFREGNKEFVESIKKFLQEKG